MTAIAAPRTAEAILESLGAAAAFRDSLIGDLSQEFATRVERYGARAARLWYYREALRAAPHLVRNWLSGATRSDARALVNVIGKSWIMTMVVEAVVFFLVMAGTAGLVQAGVDVPTFTGDRLGNISSEWFDWLLPAVAGYYAAKFDAKAPLIAATVTSLTWSALLLLITISDSGPVSASMHLWLRGSLVVVALVAGIAGGSVRVWQQARRPELA